jgi:ABC-type phosphate transport system substrate-binding protein
MMGQIVKSPGPKKEKFGAEIVKDIMNRNTRNFLSILAGVFLAGVIVPLEAKEVELVGAGATFPYPLYSKMFYAYWKETGTKVNYQVIGSGGGQRQLINMTVDFGGSDAFMHLPGTIGYVELGYTLLERMPVVILQNKAGRFIKPSPASASIAANIPLPEDTRISLTDTASSGGYPMSSFTLIWIFKRISGSRIRQEFLVFDKAAEAKAFHRHPGNVWNPIASLFKYD